MADEYMRLFDDDEKVYAQISHIINTYNLNLDNLNQILAGGFKCVDTIEERDAIPSNKLREGMCVFVENDPNHINLYQLINDQWLEFSYGVHISSTPPTNKDIVWINPSDKDVETVEFTPSETLDNIKNSIKGLRLQLDQLTFMAENTINSGLFPKDFEDKYADLPDSDEIKNGNIGHIQILRGSLEGLLAYKDKMRDGELALVEEPVALYVMSNGDLVCLTKNSSSEEQEGDDDMPSNLTATYVQLEDVNGVAYRIKVDKSGKLYAYKAEIDTAEDMAITGSDKYRKNLYISSVYGGGNGGNGCTVVSHSYIELYNDTADDINLKGTSVQVSSGGTTWNVLPLQGIIKSHCSFLIRCAEHSNINLDSVKVKIKDYDMSWDNMAISSQGVKVLLVAGTSACTVANPFLFSQNESGVYSPMAGYIDMIGVYGDGEDGISNDVGGWEGTSTATQLYIMNKHSAIRRRTEATLTGTGLKDNDATFKDLVAIDFFTQDVDIYRPRWSGDGQWNMYYDKLKLPADKPAMINLTYGKDAHNTMIITWQSLLTNSGYVKYKLSTADNYTTVNSTRQNISLTDVDCTVHYVKLTNLTAGTYDYMCGEDGNWSDKMSFVIKAKPTTTEEKQNFSFKVLQVSDQQAWDDFEYLAWKNAKEEIDKVETYDFVINTGDITQNGNRPYEYRYYYAYDDKMGKIPMMNTIGNNDIIKTMETSDINYKDRDKQFEYYFTYEDIPFVEGIEDADVPNLMSDGYLRSVYSWDYGYVHFISLNSNNYTTEQMTWLENDVTTHRTAHAGERWWYVIYLHDAPYTINIVGDSKPAKASEELLYQKLGIDLVLCGHKHTYMRSKPIYRPTNMTYADRHAKYLNGGASKGLDTAFDASIHDWSVIPTGKKPVNYVMCQATGYKLSSNKEKPEDEIWWYPAKEAMTNLDGSSGQTTPQATYAHPTYIIWEFTYDKIKMTTYVIQNAQKILADPSLTMNRVKMDEHEYNWWGDFTIGTTNVDEE